MMLASSSTDQELVAAARQGDDRAFEELYGRYRQRIRLFVHGLTRDHDRAEDITQEVFISALRRMRENDRPISFRPWVYEIARNACIDEYRRSKRAREVPIEQDGSADYGHAAVSKDPLPEEAVETKQRLQDLRWAFRGLSERHHRVIVLRELEGMSYNEIASELGMSKIIVESTLFRARRRLSEEYEDLSTGRRCEYVQRMISADAPVPVERLGRRDRGALLRHLEHCRSCRIEARAAGITEHEDRSLRRASKVALLLPVPLFRLSRRIGAKVASTARSVHGAAASSPVVSSAPYTAASLAGSGRAAVATVTLLAAVGGGLVVGGDPTHSVTISPPAARLALAANQAAPGRLKHGSIRDLAAGLSRSTGVSSRATATRSRVLARLPAVTLGAAQSRTEGASPASGTSGVTGRDQGGTPTAAGVGSGFPPTGDLPGPTPTAAPKVSVPTGTLTSSSSQVIASADGAVQAASSAAGGLSAGGGSGGLAESSVGSLGS